MSRIIPHLWFDHESREAVQLYVSTFENSRVVRSATIEGTPSGAVDIISFQLAGQDFMCINAGPQFRFTPAISFMVTCTSRAQFDAVWDKLSAGGFVMMEAGAYPFAERYGWTADRFGLSWQVSFSAGQATAQTITPCLLFVGAVCGRAEEAMNLYCSIFRDCAPGMIMRYEKGAAPDVEGTLKFAGFKIEDQEFVVMDSAHDHKFAFNEAVSLLVNCDSQAEIDYYWDKLSAVPAAEVCGWLKDRFGVSWQIVPRIMDTMLADGSEEQKARVVAAFLKMKKFDLAVLQKAYAG